MGAFLALVAVAIGASTPPTEVIRWSPFTSAGALKPTLKVESVKLGRCTDIGYTLVGGVAYRCGAGNGLYDACWRDGPSPTEFVICLGSPWDTEVTRLRSRRLLLYPGVTFDPPAPLRSGSSDRPHTARNCRTNSPSCGSHYRASTGRA